MILRFPLAGLLSTIFASTLTPALPPLSSSTLSLSLCAKTLNTTYLPAGQPGCPAAEQALSSKTERKSIASSGARSSTLDRIIAGNEWQQSGSGAGAATTMVAGAAAAKPDPLRPPDGGRHASLPAHIER